MTTLVKFSREEVTNFSTRDQTFDGLNIFAELFFVNVYSTDKVTL